MMRKVLFLSLAVIAIVFSSVIIFAQDAQPGKEPTIDEKMKEKQAKQEYIASMITQAIGSMQKQMVATNDGGVIVISGNKLLKYDKDLNLVKEADLKTRFELKIDPDSVQDMIKNMKEKYAK